MNNHNRKEMINPVNAMTFALAMAAMPAAQLQASDKPETPTATMTTALGKPMQLTLRTLPDSRDYQYCEIIFDYGDKGNDIYSTSPVAPCNLDWWSKLDAKTLAKDFGAVSVYKNGPQWWSMDEVGVMATENISVAGVEMVFGAHLPPGTTKIQHYTVFNPAKYQNLLWKAGKPVYQITDSEGHVYIVQGNKIPATEMAGLGKRFKKLPAGWKFSVVTLEQDLVMNLTPAKAIPSIQDEFDQILIRITE